MADVFARTEVAFGGAMHAQNGIISSSDNGLSGILMQNINMSYNQAITRIYELGQFGQKTNVYYVAGRSNGGLGAAHVIGPGVTMVAFYNTFGDVCNARTNTLSIDMSPNVCTASNGNNVKVSYDCKYCVLVSIGISVAAQDFVVNENSQMMFSGLDFISG